MNAIIISDTSSDILNLTGTPYASVPMKISTDEQEFVDDKNLDVSAMVSYLKKFKGASKSSCPNIQEWQDEFKDYDTIFCVAITSNLSGSYNSAKLALEEHLSNNKNVQGIVIDTLSAGPEVALIVEKLRELITKNLSFAEIKNRIMEYKNKTHLLFSLESLTNLANNGRISHTSAKIAGLLGIRAIGQASSEGTLEMLNKVRGGDKAINELYKQMREKGYLGGKVRIHHCQNKNGAKKLQKEINKIFPSANVSIHETKGLCSFYAEPGGILVGFEGAVKNN